MKRMEKKKKLKTKKWDHQKAAQESALKLHPEYLKVVKLKNWPTGNQVLILHSSLLNTMVVLSPRRGTICFREFWGRIRKNVMPVA